VAELLTILLKITVVIFMAGNLLDLGLRMNLQAALRGLRDVRFVTLSVLWAFVLCPALAYGLTMVVPMTPPFAMGLILLGLAPCAPLLPMMADKARGDLNYTASFMLLASAGTVVYMPLMVPLLVRGLTVSAWTVAKPMLVLVLIPLVIGVVIESRSASTASSIQPVVKKGTGVDTLLMLILVIVIYGKGFIGAVGTYAILTRVVFFSLVTAASYALGFGMPHGQESVVALGVCTRNCGAALASPLLRRAFFPGVSLRPVREVRHEQHPERSRPAQPLSPDPDLGSGIFPPDLYQRPDRGGIVTGMLIP
jgi:BASS family bile acid:Na+ symporter